MKKKVLIIMLTFVMLVIGSVTVYALVDCTHNNGTAMGLISHDTRGANGCIATERYYCDLCNTTFYIASDIEYTSCPTWHRRNPNWQKNY